MIYQDRIYGQVEITEPVILDLINCPSMQRLKDIDQAGYFEPFFPGSSHSRFEHSVGVYLLLNRYGAPLAEQIAGLLHDVSHSAFSHAIDYVLAEDKAAENAHQDSIHDSFVKRSEMPGILAVHGFDVDYILNDANFPLKETELPDLCADRIDYMLRGAMVYGEKTFDQIQYFLNNLTADNQKWIFKDYQSARAFAEMFSFINRKYYRGIITAVMFTTLADILKYSLRQGYITEEDFYATDKIVLAKIEPFRESDQRLRLLFKRMNNKVPYRDDPDKKGKSVSCKSRVVDPLCWQGNEIKHISEIDPKWKDFIRTESVQKSYSLIFEK